MAYDKDNQIGPWPKWQGNLEDRLQVTLIVLIGKTIVGLVH
jgi:hypothetical protein